MTADELIAQVPDEHKTVIDGKVCLTELGLIHLCTLVEQQDPEKAEKARALRYSASRFAAGYRRQGSSEG